VSLVQFNHGPYTPSSGNIVITLANPTDPANCVVVGVTGNALATQPAGNPFALRNSQIDLMGQYLWDKQGAGDNSWTFTQSGGGGGHWWVAEILDGVFLSANGQRGGTGASPTASVTPASGLCDILASVGCISGSASAVRTLNALTNGFVELGEGGDSANDSPMGAVALLEVTANGSTAYSTSATFSGSTFGQTSILAAYSTTASGDATATPAVVATTAALPTVAIQAGGDAAVGPAVIAATTALPAPTVTAQVNATVTPGVVAASVAMSDWAVDVGAGPETVAVTTVLPAAGAGSTTLVEPATITTTADLPAATTSASVTVTPATIATVASLPAASTGTGVTTEPATIAAVASLPSVTIQTAGNATVTPSSIAVTASLPQASPSGGGVVLEVAIYTGAVTGPGRFVEAISGPAIARDVDGPNLARTVTGPGAQT
jgi:hypothetical protein